MKENMKNTLSEIVNVMKDYGWDYGLSEKIIDRLENTIYDKKLLPVRKYLFAGKGERNLLLNYVLTAYKEEEEYEELIYSSSDVEDADYYELKRTRAAERNEYLFNTALKYAISSAKTETTCRIFDFYDLRLEGLFEYKFNRIPKKIEEIKKAAALAIGDVYEIVDFFDMKVINCLKKKGIEDMNIFMFIIKNPWLKKSEVNKLSKKEILELSREKSNVKIREFRSFLIKREGTSKAFKIYKNLKTEGFEHVSDSFFYFREKISEMEEYATTLDIVELLKYNSINSIEKMFNSCYFNRVKNGELTLLEAATLAQNNIDVSILMKKHDLRDIPVTLGRETASIMAWNDIRQFFLGNYTHCCQTIDGVGESSMLFGLVSKHSGFFTIQRDGKVLAQAWVWEAKADTLVLDNIELADCREVDQFIDILYRWVKESPYENIQLGLGYSDMKVGVPMTYSEIKYYSLFRSRAFTKATKNFFRGKEIYTDAQERRNWLKKGGEMQFSKISFEKQKELEEEEERLAMLANLEEYAIDAIF